MDVKVETENKTVITTTSHVENGILKTHPCKIGDFYSYRWCEEININKEIKKVNIPNGEYKITVTIEKIN
jgi:hypothetical protein